MGRSKGAKERREKAIKGDNKHKQKRVRERGKVTMKHGVNKAKSRSKARGKRN